MDVFAKTGECRGLETGECRGLETSTSRAAGGRTFNTAGGKVAAIVGEAPKRVAMNEWDSLEQAQAFYNSKAWKDLAPHHNRAQKLTRLYAVEAIKKVGRFRTRQSRKRDPARTEEERGLDGVSRACHRPSIRQ